MNESDIVLKTATYIIYICKTLPSSNKWLLHRFQDYYPNENTCGKTESIAESHKHPETDVLVQVSLT